MISRILIFHKSADNFLPALECGDLIFSEPSYEMPITRTADQIPLVSIFSFVLSVLVFSPCQEKSFCERWVQWVNRVGFPVEMEIQLESIHASVGYPMTA